jgi:hypothetical protein
MPSHVEDPARVAGHDALLVLVVAVGNGQRRRSHQRIDLGKQIGQRCVVEVANLPRTVGGRRLRTTPVVQL